MRVNQTTYREAISAFLICSIAVLLMWSLASYRGAVGIARADDWSYLLTQFEFGRSGEFVLNNWAVTMLVGQTLAAAPVTVLTGASIVWHQAFVSAFAIVGLWLSYLLVRRYLPMPWAILSIATLALGPLFAASAISFMTDVPALALMAGSLLAGAIALDRRSVSWPWFVLSLALSLVAFTFRDYALIAGVAVGLVVVARERGSRARALNGAGSLALLVLLASLLYMWRHSLPNDLKLPGWSLDYSTALLGRASITAALLTSPVLVFVSIGALWRRVRQRVWAVVLTLTLWIGLIGVSGFEFLGNVVHPFGTTWLLTGPGLRLWPLWMNRFLLVAGIAFLLLLSLLVSALGVQWLRPRDSADGPLARLMDWVSDLRGSSVLVVFPAVLFVTHCAATIALGTWWIDRYFILWIPFAAAGILILARRYGWLTASRGRFFGSWTLQRVLAGAWCAGFVMLGFHVADFDALVDGTRWRVASEAADGAVSVSSVDGGMPFVAFHEPGPGIGAQVVPLRPGRTWWTERYPGREFCRTVGFAPNVADVPISAITVDPLRSFFGSGGFIYVVAGPDTCSPS